MALQSISPFQISAEDHSKLLCPSTRQLHDTNLAKMNLGSFGFEAQEPFPTICLSDTIYKFPVDREFYRSIDSDYHIAVPLPLSLAAHLV